MRGGPARAIGALAAIGFASSLALAVSLTRPMPASACSGADPVRPTSSSPTPARSSSST